MTTACMLQLHCLENCSHWVQQDNPQDEPPHVRISTESGLSRGSRQQRQQKPWQRQQERAPLRYRCIQWPANCCAPDRQRRLDQLVLDSIAQHIGCRVGGYRGLQCSSATQLCIQQAEISFVGGIATAAHSSHFESTMFRGRGLSLSLSCFTLCCGSHRRICQPAAE